MEHAEWKRGADRARRDHIDAALVRGIENATRAGYTKPADVVTSIKVSLKKAGVILVWKHKGE